MKMVRRGGEETPGLAFGSEEIAERCMAKCHWQLIGPWDVDDGLQIDQDADDFKSFDAKQVRDPDDRKRLKG